MQMHSFLLHCFYRHITLLLWCCHYKFDLKENKVEEFENHSITFNLSYKFEECEFIHVDQTFNQVGMNAEGKVNLVSLNKKLFSI